MSQFAEQACQVLQLVGHRPPHGTLKAAGCSDGGGGSRTRRLDIYREGCLPRTRFTWTCCATDGGAGIERMRRTLEAVVVVALAVAIAAAVVLSFRWWHTTRVPTEVHVLVPEGRRIRLRAGAIEAPGSMGHLILEPRLQRVRAQHASAASRAPSQGRCTALDSDGVEIDVAADLLGQYRQLLTHLAGGRALRKGDDALEHEERRPREGR